MKLWKRIDPTTEVRSEYRTLTVKTFKLPDGQVLNFDTYDREDQQVASAIALTRDKKVIVVRQFRPGPEAFMDDLPGGTAEANETLQEAMLREFEEETGYQTGNVEYLGKIYKNAYMNTTNHYFLVTGCVPTGNGQRLDGREQADVHTISIDEFLDNARNARMTDVGAVFLAYEKLLKMKR
jgi:ADP-ribose pyrophosphatase